MKPTYYSRNRARLLEKSKSYYNKMKLNQSAESKMRQKEYQRQYYIRNRDRFIQSATIRRRANNILPRIKKVKQKPLKVIKESKCVLKPKPIINDQPMHRKTNNCILHFFN